MRQAESILAMKKLMAAGIGLMGCIGLLMGCAEVVVPGAISKVFVKNDCRRPIYGAICLLAGKNEP